MKIVLYLYNVEILTNFLAEMIVCVLIRMNVSFSLKRTLKLHSLWPNKAVHVYKKVYKNENSRLSGHFLKNWIQIEVIKNEMDNKTKTLKRYSYSRGPFRRSIFSLKMWKKRNLCHNFRFLKLIVWILYQKPSNAKSIQHMALHTMLRNTYEKRGNELFEALTRGQPVSRPFHSKLIPVYFRWLSDKEFNFMK